MFLHGHHHLQGLVPEAQLLLIGSQLRPPGVSANRNLQPQPQLLDLVEASHYRS